MAEDLQPEGVRISPSHQIFPVFLSAPSPKHPIHRTQKQFFSVCVCVCVYVCVCVFVCVFSYDCFVSLQMIEEFTDVNQGEKEVMKLWNLFALENG